MAITFPTDWPLDGPIDLAVQDLPHRSSSSEWWYVNSHITLPGGRQVSVFAAFFRIVTDRDEVTGELTYAHSLTWALTDMGRGEYHAESLVDKRSPELGLRKLEEGQGSKDPRLNRAIKEILDKGRVPRPDQMFKEDPYINLTRLELDFDGRLFQKTDDGTYKLFLHNPQIQCGVELEFIPEKPVIRHGDDGVVRGAAGEYMFYYFIPRCRVEGTVTMEARTVPVVKGQGWYDHEFGGHLVDPEVQKAAAEAEASGAASSSGGSEAAHGSTSQNARGPRVGNGLRPRAQASQSQASDESQALPDEDSDAAWNWVAIQLDNGVDITAYTIVEQGRSDGEKPILGQGLIVSNESGKRSAVVTTPTLEAPPNLVPPAEGEMTFEPIRVWRSKRSFNDYPVAWRLVVPRAEVDLLIEADVDDQEFITVISKPAFWEGRCRVSGIHRGDQVTGLAYLERSGFETVQTLDDFFKAVGEEVRASVEGVLPLEPSFEQVRDLVAGPDRPHYVEYVDRPQLSETLFQPVREITDRGGKSWRSYAALACCDVVGGDSRKWTRWLAMPEFMHVGSLIVDDVQDKSRIRRGGPAAHLIYGDALAINAGTAAYFLGQRLLVGDEVSDAVKLRLYDLYFDALRAGHAGQAIDIDGFARFVPPVLETGDAEELIEHILACHRLKTAAPAGSLARMGALVGGGDEEQVEGIGDFFEALGMAFQIVDDVLNLRGFAGDLKEAGEDISKGAVTMPVGVAFGRLEQDKRLWLWNTLSTCPDDPAVVSSVIELIEACGALDECDTMARDLIENAWQRLDPMLEPSTVKVMLRGFGWYVLERHY